MADDPIVAEVRRHREEIAKEFGYDLRAIFEYFKKREKEEGRKVVSRARPKGRGERGTSDPAIDHGR